MKVSRASTPPHHPTHGVGMTFKEIQNIMSTIRLEMLLESVEPLPTGRSFNNRIYYLTCSHLRDTNSTDPRPEKSKLVLKLNGRFFGPDKIQNEVSCLQLLERHCARTTAPRVLAWSETGESAEVIASDGRERCQPMSIPALDNSAGWILMTRVPGEPMSTFKLSPDALLDLAMQLADHVSDWRRLIPAQKHCGNLCFCQDEYAHETPDLLLSHVDSPRTSPVVLRGLLGEGIRRGIPIPDVKEWYAIRLQHQIERLETEATFTPNRSLSTPLRRFLTSTLPSLFASNTAVDEFVFTHHDLSPRNILISEEPPMITGIVDFEFAGFFPPLAEFLNDAIHNEGDWPQDAYDGYLAGLEKNGIPTPARGIDKANWEKACQLELLLQHVAPWWLPEEPDEEKKKQDLEKSKHHLLGAIEGLEHSS